MAVIECAVVRSLPGFYLLLGADEYLTVVEASNDFLGATGWDRPTVLSLGAVEASSRLAPLHRPTDRDVLRHTLQSVLATGTEHTWTSERPDPRLVAAEAGNGEGWSVTHRPVRAPAGAIAFILSRWERVAPLEWGRQPFSDLPPGSAGPRSEEAPFPIEQRALAENELLATHILESITEGFFGLDRHWRFTYVNHEAQHILGRPAKDLIGRDIWVEYPGLFGSPFEALYRNAMDKREPGSLVAFYPDHDCHYDVHTYPAPHGMSVYFRNVTDRIRAEEKREQAEREVREQAQQLRDLDQAKDQFLATLAHELRNPLAPLQTAAQILGGLGPGDERVTWASQVIQRQVRQMAALLDDLLNAARITRGKLDLRRELVDLAGIVTTSIESARPLIDSKSQQLVISLPTSPLLLEVDPLRLAQVLSNLLSNAAKYTGVGGKIGLSARTEGEELVLTVEDNGIGVPASAQQSIFTMFTQVDGAGVRSQGGLGIGLALAMGLVKLHDGTLAVESEGQGRGSRFVVRLPLPTGNATSLAQVAVAHPTNDLSPSRIVVADDNKDAADTLAMLLRFSGHEVWVAHGGAEAIRLSVQHQPNVALLDIGMPDVDGREVARRLRSEPWATCLTLVALTGYGQAEDKVKSVAAGFDHHLTKPVDPAELDAILAGRRSD